MQFIARYTYKIFLIFALNTALKIFDLLVHPTGFTDYHLFFSKGKLSALP